MRSAGKYLSISCLLRHFVERSKFSLYCKVLVQLNKTLGISWTVVPCIAKIIEKTYIFYKTIYRNFGSFFGCSFSLNLILFKRISNIPEFRKMEPDMFGLAVYKFRWKILSGMQEVGKNLIPNSGINWIGVNALTWCSHDHIRSSSS